MNFVDAKAGFKKLQQAEWRLTDLVNVCCVGAIAGITLFDWDYIEGNAFYNRSIAISEGSLETVQPSLIPAR